MSVIAVTTIATTGTELTGILESLSALAPIASSPALPIAVALAGAVVVGKIFERVWNANRTKISGIEVNLRNVISETQKIGASIQSVVNDFYSQSTSLLSKVKEIEEWLGYKYDIQALINKTNAWSNALFQQVISWTQQLAIIHIAGSDNAFYTLNKDDVDAIIDANTSSPPHTSAITNLGQGTIQAIKALIDQINKEYEKVVYLQLTITSPEKTIAGITVTAPTTRDSLATPSLPSLEELYEQYKKGLIAGRLADLIRDLINSISITRTKTINAKGGKWKWRKPKWPKEAKGRKKPKKIREAWVDTTPVSNWISKVTFRFPVAKDINSDDRGTLTVHIKKGGTIRFVRVKRGTFSVISLVYGTGFRIWSQFWKKRIVNRHVLSWFIKIINAQDRAIAIPQEIKDKRIKYK